MVYNLQEEIVESTVEWTSDKLKLEQMLPLLSIVDETCTPLVLQILDPLNTISSSDSVQQLLETRRSLFLKLTPKKQ